MLVPPAGKTRTQFRDRSCTPPPAGRAWVIWKQCSVKQKVPLEKKKAPKRVKLGGYRGKQDFGHLNSPKCHRLSVSSHNSSRMTFQGKLVRSDLCLCEPEPGRPKLKLNLVQTGSFEMLKLDLSFCFSPTAGAT